MDISTVRRFRENIRHIERELNIQSNSNCCSGVSLAQCHTLLELFPHKGMNLGELSKRLYLDKSTVSRTIESLVKNGTVNRSIPKENRRKIILSLTDKGKGICREINSGSDAYFGAIIDSIPKEDLPIFLKSFEIFVKKMIQSNLEQRNSC